NRPPAPATRQNGPATVSGLSNWYGTLTQIGVKLPKDLSPPGSGHFLSEGRIPLFGGHHMPVARRFVWVAPVALSAALLSVPVASAGPQPQHPSEASRPRT